MRRILSLVLLSALSLPAMADEPPKPDTPPAHHPRSSRQTWEQRFAEANTAHDGHLTRQEAAAGYPLVAKHFDDIDVDHKDYVTANDMRAWQVMRKAAHQLTQPPEDKFRPRAAFQRIYPNTRAPTVPRNQTMIPQAMTPA